ncbi:protein Lines homolog 1 isoform X2 [Narcine bancroftii]|uniref:protein Lines homolog 1 isoform X2 n=1 Tax=Narcine bancroftii TaxID=1343680 RepID=UPI0038317D92
MEKGLIFFRQFYSELLAGVKPSKSSHELAMILSPDVVEKDSVFPINTKKNNETPHFQGSSLSEDAHGMLPAIHSSTNNNWKEILLLQMNMIQLMSSKLYSKIPKQDVRETYLKTITILLEDTEIVSKLKPPTHWMNSCLDILSKEPGSQQSAYWLQTITVIVKEILKGNSQDKAGVLQKLLIPVDLTFPSLYFFTFSSPSGVCQIGGDVTGPDIESVATTNQIAVVEVLEVFIAIRNQLELNLSCLRTLYMHVPHILDFVTSSVQYFVKKRLILLLKKCVLEHANDANYCPSRAPSQQDSNIHDDLLAVSRKLLQAVMSGWLRQIPVSPRPCFFGGSEIFDAENLISGPDMVMLRAVSLILIKAIEINLKNTRDEAKDKGCLKNKLQSYMSQLMLFLRMNLQTSTQFQQLSHRCAWVSFVFMEQDDDLVEVANALLTIYTYSSGFLDSHPQKKAATSQEACQQCFNPHCIFLQLLQSVAFDHCVLLDFLISTETCFLEYLVKYLRFLRMDWHSFRCICAQFDAVAEPFCPSPVDRQFTTEVEGDRQTLNKASRKAILSPQIPQHPSPKGKPHRNSELVVRSKRTQLRKLPQSLVNYDTSEDSDSDDGETTCMNTNTLGGNEMNKTVTIDKALQHQPEITRIVKGVNSQTCEKIPEVELSLEGMFKKSVGCLIELRKAIGRLQRRNLFPYNATPLVKLLLDIEARGENDAVSP